MLISDLAYRENTSTFEIMRVFNSLQLKEHAGFVAFATSLDLVRASKASFEGRYPIFDILGVECDAVVSHHWENAQNYLYYETLHAGFPIIHNSDLLGGCGYRYRNYDPLDGALALLQAFAEHDQNIANYRRDASAFLATLDPCADQNINSYSSAILSVVERVRTL